MAKKNSKTNILLLCVVRHIFWRVPWWRLVVHAVSLFWGARVTTWDRSPLQRNSPGSVGRICNESSTSNLYILDSGCKLHLTNKYT